jgi:ribosomal protein S18 acetylase RimI-like enzyme
MAGALDYRINAAIRAEQFIDLLERSTLAARRPVGDRACIEGMLQHANLCVTAWDGGRLVGVARSLTDFHYACYLSDLAVDAAYQRRGIGRTLVALTRSRLGPRCTIRLVAAPAAADYYHRIGFVRNERCWELPGELRRDGA